MWRPRTINLDVDGHAYKLQRAKTGWSEVGKPLPPGLWAEVDRPVKRAVFWWRVRLALFAFIFGVYCVTLAFRVMHPSPPLGALPPSAPTVSWYLSFPLFPAALYGVVVYLSARAPLAIKHSVPGISHEPQCRSCKYSLAGLAPNNANLLVCPECGAKN